MCVIKVREKNLSATTMDAVFRDVAIELTMAQMEFEDEATIDLRELNFIDPYGLVCIWSIVSHLRRFFERVEIVLPHNHDVQAYMGRMGFFNIEDDKVTLLNQYAEPLQPSTDSEVLLELTPITQDSSLTSILETILPRVANILQHQLGYADGDITNFTTTLSETCQNIYDHSESCGVAAVQSYHNRSGDPFVTVGVADCGCGIRQSLSERYVDALDWDHGTAITQALKQKYSRFPDRGLGLYRITQIVTKYQGRLHIRSGDTRICYVRNRRTEHVGSDFPGTQVYISLAEPTACS